MLSDIERATHLIARRLEPVLTKLELTQGEAHVLAQLAPHTGLTATQLHREFGHKRSTLTNLLDRLEQRGLVARTPNPSDRRSIIVALTARGRPVAGKVLAARERLEQDVRARVSERDVAGLRSITRALQNEAGR
jgi:DNA-binding MarR family transcriptional regulator